MKWHHVAVLAGVAFVAYMVGVMYPSIGTQLKSKVGM